MCETELLCCQRVGLAKEYDFDGISSRQLMNENSALGMK